jgi:hypothetical protein
MFENRSTDYAKIARGGGSRQEGERVAKALETQEMPGVLETRPQEETRLKYEPG